MTINYAKTLYTYSYVYSYVYVYAYAYPSEPSAEVLYHSERKECKMTVNEKIHGFTVTRVRDLPELDGSLIELTHDKTGLQAIWIKRPDENKTFGIAFETLPWNDTGVFHILEHSVLCGSDKYRVKEPFVELLKSSMNTFLNAMTYPDKTVYPVCSRNDKDFMNLTRVYLDAVFRPLIYSKPEIFHQEGWHYEFDENGKPSYKGVVFNEMKGAMADADELMICALNVHLFPDSPYRYVSGGDPAKIPDLSYEEFINSHRRFYSPSNACMFLDGEVNIDEVLGVVDDEYLSGFEKSERMAPPALQKPVKTENVEVEFEVGEDEDISKKTRLAWGSVIGMFDEREKIVAMHVLSKVLAGSNQAPLNKAVLGAGLAEEVSVEIYDGIYQPWAFIQAKNLEAANKDKVEKVIFDELARLAREGLDRDQLNAALANYEFKERECDSGSVPQGLVYSLNTLSTWLYGGDPITELEIGDLFVNLRKKMDEGYFEQLISEILINNPHSCKVTMNPSKTAGEVRRKLEADRLAKEEAAWSEDKCAELKAEQKVLEEWQHSTDSEEDLKSIPSLKISDISDEPEVIPAEETVVNGIKVLKHDINCGGIVYCNLYFDADGLSEKDISELSFMCELMGKLRTSNHTEEEVANLTKLLCGSLNFSVAAYDENNCVDSCLTKLVVSFSTLKSNIDKAVEFVSDLLTKTVFDKESDALDILRQTKMKLFQRTVMAGNSIALTILRAQISASGVVDECAGGFSYYKWLRDNESGWNWTSLKATMADLAGKIVNAGSLTASFTGVDDEIVEKAVGILSKALPKGEGCKCDCCAAVKPRGISREGIVIPADICFAVKGGNLAKLGSGFCGEMELTSKIVSLAYLWNVIRVQGGAYGCGMPVFNNGIVANYSYRDPSAAKSLESYSKTGEFIKGFAASSPDLTGFIIGAVADCSPLLSPRLKATVADRRYWRKTTTAERREYLRAIISATPATLNDLADKVQSALDSGSVCVVAAREKIDACGEFDNIESL